MAKKATWSEFITDFKIGPIIVKTEDVIAQIPPEHLVHECVFMHAVAFFDAFIECCEDRRARLGPSKQEAAALLTRMDRLRAELEWHVENGEDNADDADEDQ